MSRPARINPDSRPVLALAVGTTAVLAAVSFLLSYSGLVAVAEWAAVPSWLAWAVPVTIDGAILVYTLAVLVFRARGEETRPSSAVLALWSIVSVVANALHAWLESTGDARGVAGAVIAGLAPVAVLLSTHTLAALIVERPALESVPAEAVPAPVLEEEPVQAPVLAEDPVLVAVPAASAVPAPIIVPVETVPSRPAVPASPERDALILELSKEGRSIRSITAETGVSKSTVARVLARLA